MYVRMYEWMYVNRPWPRFKVNHSMLVVHAGTPTYLPTYPTYLPTDLPTYREKVGYITPNADYRKDEARRRDAKRITKENIALMR